MKNFFILPNNVLSVSPEVILTRVLASVNVGCCKFLSASVLAVSSFDSFDWISVIHLLTKLQNQLKTFADGLYPALNPSFFRLSLGSVPVFFHSGKLLLKFIHLFSPLKYFLSNRRDRYHRQILFQCYSHFRGRQIQMSLYIHTNMLQTDERVSNPQ